MSYQRADGMRYAPQGKPNPVCEKGEFRFAAIGLDHGHILGMTNGLLEAGGEVAWVYDPDPQKIAEYQKSFPDAKTAISEAQILEDPTIDMVASAAIPNQRCEIGLRAMDHGKHYFSDKPPMTTLDQLAAARAKVKETGKRFAVYFSERLHVEAAVYAGELIEAGLIGKVIQVVNLAPHRLSASARPEWFWQTDQYGGILCDIGSHQIEQFLFYAGAKDAQVMHSTIGNYNTPQYPEFQDFGDANLLADNGAMMYFRVDWFTPDALPVWGDGRTFVTGTEGMIELRKYIDIGRDHSSDHLYLLTHDREEHIEVKGRVGFPFFGQLILDCLNGSELSMTQEHIFKAAELGIVAQNQARWVTEKPGDAA